MRPSRSYGRSSSFRATRAGSNRLAAEDPAKSEYSDASNHIAILVRPNASARARRRRDHLPAHHLDRFDPVHADHPADTVSTPRLASHSSCLMTSPAFEPSSPTSKRTAPSSRSRRIRGRPRCTGAGAGRACADIRRRRDVAGVAVAGDERQGPLLAATGDQDRRMWPGEALRHVLRPAEPNVSALERPLVAALAGPHPQADLDGLLEDLEPLAERRDTAARAPRASSS